MINNFRKIVLVSAIACTLFGQVTPASANHSRRSHHQQERYERRYNHDHHRSSRRRYRRFDHKNHNGHRSKVNYKRHGGHHNKHHNHRIKLFKKLVNL